MTFDIVVPIFNSMHHVRDCLESIFKHSTLPFHLYLVDDGCSEYTKSALSALLQQVDSQKYTIIVNSSNQGYLKSCNMGISRGNSPYVILLNSDTIVTPAYLEKVLLAFEKDSSIGVINPVSTWANWTRIPFPAGYNIHELSDEVEFISKGILADINNASGFFFAVRRRLFDELGLFDEIYDPGYYEEADFCMRALEANFRVVVDDSLYIFHHGWGSFSEQGRNKYMELNRHKFMKRWANKFDSLAATWELNNPVSHLNNLLESPARWKEKDKQNGAHDHSIELDAAHYLINQIIEDESYIKRSASISKQILPIPIISKAPKVIYVLPQLSFYGGVISVVQLINRLVVEGIDANIATYGTVDERLLKMFPLYFRPYVFPNQETLVAEFPRADLAVATHWETAYPLVALRELRPELRLMYYVQDFEPDFYDSDHFNLAQLAERTYSMIPDQVVKTTWLKNKLTPYEGNIEIIPLGLNLDLFHQQEVPRKKQIISMARPSSVRRNFLMLKAVYEEIHRLRPDITLALFGSGYSMQSLYCPIVDYGELTTMQQSASALSESLVLLDCSLFQGFGRPGLEAMACGTAAVLTREGGITEYAKHEYNCYLIDPLNLDDIVQKLISLVDDQTKQRLFVENGLKTAARFSHLNEGNRTKELIFKLLGNGLQKDNPISTTKSSNLTVSRNLESKSKNKQVESNLGLSRPMQANE